MRPSVLDRVILELAPSVGRKRIHSKAAANAVMNYDAATRGRRTYGWKAPGTSADVAAGMARAQLRNLARDMVRNRPIAARAQSVIASNVVGSGIRPSVTLDEGDDGLKAEIDKVIKNHLETTALDSAGAHTLYTFQSLAIKSTATDGEILFRRRWRNNQFRRGLELPFQIEALEADHLDENVKEYGGNPVHEGIEIGPTGAPVAYHLRANHPGGWLNLRNYFGKSERVLAADIIHVRRLDRPGQVRGVSWFAPVLLTMGELSDYQEAEILKQRMAALLAGVITSEDDEGADRNAAGIEDLAPGAIAQLAPGQQITFTTPPKVDSYEAFMRGSLRTVASGLGLTYEALSGDLSGTNFSSGRLGRLEMNRNILEWQTSLVVGQFLAGLGRWFVEAWQVDPLHKRALPDDFAINWTPPRPPMVDPSREVPAAIKEIDAGLTSLSRKQRELGYDPAQIHKERLEDAVRAQEIEKVKEKTE